MSDWERLDPNDVPLDGFIIAQVGGGQMVIPLRLFAVIHQQTADEMRALGMSGAELDAAIEARLPARLAALLGDVPCSSVH